MWDNQHKPTHHPCRRTDHHQDTYPEWEDPEVEFGTVPFFAIAGSETETVLLVENAG